MAIFTYKAKKMSGEEISGQREANDKRELTTLLHQDGYILTSALEGSIKPKKGTITLPKLFGSVPLEEKIMFARNLSVMIGAGVALAKGLEVLEKNGDTMRRAILGAYRKACADFGEEQPEEIHFNPGDELPLAPTAEQVEES